MMESESSKPVPNVQLHKLAEALGDMRDSLVTISLALTDLVTEMPSPARDEAAIEVERYLARISEANRRGFD